MGFFALLKLVPARAWEILAAIALLVIYSGWIAYEARKGPVAALAAKTAQMDAFVAQTKALGETAQKAADARQKADQQAKKDADNDHQADIAKLGIAWGAELDKLRKQSAANTRRDAMRPVTVSTSLSCSTAAADRISAAVSESIAGARTALDECRNAAVSFRDETARGFEQADRNTEALVCGVTWAGKTLGK